MCVVSSSIITSMNDEKKKDIFTSATRLLRSITFVINVIRRLTIEEEESKGLLLAGGQRKTRR